VVVRQKIVYENSPQKIKGSLVHVSVIMKALEVLLPPALLESSGKKPRENPVGCRDPDNSWPCREAAK
jgi:hypothetical protein